MSLRTPPRVQTLRWWGSPSLTSPYAGCRACDATTAPRPNEDATPDTSATETESGHEHEGPHKKLTPRLQFPEFRESGAWFSGPLTDLCDFNPTYDDLPKRFVYIDLVSVTRRELHQRIAINCEGASSRAQRLLDRDNVLFQLVRPYQRNNLDFRDSDDQYVASTDYAQLRPRVDPVFLYQIIHTCSSVSDDLTRYTGSIYPASTPNDFGAINVARPPSPAEQRKIAGLGSLDAWIAAEADRLGALRRHKTGLMQQLFPRPGQTRPRLRFLGFRNAGEWADKTIKVTCDLKAGDFVPAASIAEQQTDGLYPCYGGNGLRNVVASFNHEGPHVLIGRQGALCGNVSFSAATLPQPSTRSSRRTAKTSPRNGSTTP